MTLSYPPLLKDGIKNVRSGTLKPSDWARMCCDLIDLYDADLKAWSYYNREQVISAAKELDQQKWDQMKPDPFLSGAPIGVKDIFNTADHPNSMGSPARANYWPGNDARVVTSAKLRGAQIIGKTTTAEFAVHYAPATLNPHDSSVIAGTSSTGSAVAVATGMVPVALGTQSAGSIARPASYNGVVGFKPSFGMVPRTGILKTCDTFDTVGWMARCVEDCSILLEALSVHGDNYPPIEAGKAVSSKRYGGRKSFKLAVLKAAGFENITKDSWSKLHELANQLGNKKEIEIVELDLQEKLKTAHAAHATIYDKSLAYYFQRELQKEELISPIFAEIVERAKAIEPRDFFSAQDEQERLTNLVRDEFNNVDFFMLPSTAGEAVLVGQSEPKDSSLIWTLTGCPVISLPLLRGPKGLPVGVTFVGPKYSDFELLRFAKTHIMQGEAEIVVPVTEEKMLRKALK